MKHALIWAGIAIILTIASAHAHEELTGDAAHDANLLHDQPAEPSVNQKDVSSWEDAAPFIIVLFVGLGAFAFAMGVLLHPRKSAR